ncbi:hypothetical protein HAZT_HAZT007437 [Hyalella azteca]|uniref:Uncharacterized protein n=1 Tax=Hyalella azteca TaxID=294128 RepID=A0A6A0GVS6_HYAAZ|nr:hypothetical protein HAZT_HAZT007437 [Hyalella azteca]
MLKKPDVSNTTQPRVYVFPIFEVEENSLPPKTKEELIKMLDSKHAIPFHERICKPCHNIPHSEVSLEAIDHKSSAFILSSVPAPCVAAALI